MGNTQKNTELQIKFIKKDFLHSNIDFSLKVLNLRTQHLVLNDASLFLLICGRFYILLCELIIICLIIYDNRGD